MILTCLLSCLLVTLSLRAGLVATEERTFNLRFLQPVDPLVANQLSQASENLKNSLIPLWRNGRGPVERAHLGNVGKIVPL